MKRIKVSVRSLMVVVGLMASLFIGSAPASAASAYDDIVQTTTSVELQTSTTYCSSSTASEHNTDWSSVVSTALSTYNAEHNNAIADWESDWSNKVGWAVFPFTGSNNQKFFFVYYSASYGENVFFNSGGTDYFTISDPAPATPFRSLIIMTKGDYYGNCNDQPLIGSASTGGLSLTADNFNTGYKLFLSTFTTFYPSGYEGVLIPSEYAPPTPVYYSGTVDCGNDKVQALVIHQDGNSSAATWSYEQSNGNPNEHRATWQHELSSSLYSISAGCGASASDWDFVTSPGFDETPYSNNDWMCTDYCILS